jgi:hypothetical protein
MALLLHMLYTFTIKLFDADDEGDIIKIAKEHFSSSTTPVTEAFSQKQYV